MTDTIVNQYCNLIKEKLVVLNEHEFLGDITFRLNHKEGGVANMNVSLSKCIDEADMNFILKEMHNLADDKFTGNVEYKFIREQDETEIRITVNQSIKLV